MNTKDRRKAKSTDRHVKIGHIYAHFTLEFRWFFLFIIIIHAIFHRKMCTIVGRPFNKAWNIWCFLVVKSEFLCKSLRNVTPKIPDSGANRTLYHHLNSVAMERAPLIDQKHSIAPTTNTNFMHDYIHRLETPFCELLWARNIRTEIEGKYLKI